MAFNEAEGWLAFPFNVPCTSIPGPGSVQCSWREVGPGTSFHAEHKEGNPFVVSPMQETHPSPTDRHCTTRAACDTRKSKNKKIGRAIVAIELHFSMHCSPKSPQKLCLPSLHPSGLGLCSIPRLSPTSQKHFWGKAST